MDNRVERLLRRSRCLCTYVYLSLGDREEFTKNKAVAQVADNVRWEHKHLKQTLGADHTALEWNPGNHFMDDARRTARGFAWCIEKICNFAATNSNDMTMIQ